MQKLKALISILLVPFIWWEGVIFQKHYRIVKDDSGLLETCEVEHVNTDAMGVHTVIWEAAPPPIKFFLLDYLKSHHGNVDLKDAI